MGKDREVRNVKEKGVERGGTGVPIKEEMHSTNCHSLIDIMDSTLIIIPSLMNYLYWGQAIHVLQSGHTLV